MLFRSSFCLLYAPTNRRVIIPNSPLLQYFTLSGLSTDLGLLNDGITWGYTIAICAMAYTGKFGACSIAARFAGFSWRESTTIGSLMSCKGQAFPVFSTS